MSYFIDGYNNQDLFVLRNGEPFNFGHFYNLPIGYSLTFTFFLYNKEFVGSYENVIFDPIAGSVTAYMYSHPTEKQLSFFMARITVVDYAGIDVHQNDILVYLHGYISNVWLTPNPLTLRSNISNVKFSINILFSDGIVINIDYYPGLLWSLDIGAPDFILIDSNSGRINIDYSHGSYPTTFPQTYSNSIKVALPSCFTYSGFPGGTITVLSGNGNLTLFSGDINKVDTNMNVLILSDGFLATQQSVFTQYATEVVSAFNSNIAKPWNLFKDTTNYWFYFLESTSEGGQLSDVYIKFQSLTGDVFVNIVHVLSLYKKVFEKLRILPPTLAGIAQLQNLVQSYFPCIDYTIVNTFHYPTPITGTSTIIPPVNSNSVEDLISYFGLPGAVDYGKDMSTRTGEWSTICSNPIFNSGTPQGTLDDFTYDLWRLLFNRIVYSKPDTALGAYRNLKDILMNIGEDKFENKIYFNKFIHTLSLGGVPVGSYFFDSAGNPLKDANNIITLVRMQNATLYGLHTEGVEGKLILSNVYSGDVREAPGVSVGSGVVYPSIIPLPPNMGTYSQLTPVHELSHNFVDDEYGKGDGIGDVYNSTIDDSAFELNIQGDNSLMSSGIINGNKIRWAWPRIRKIGISSSGLQFITGYSFVMGATSPTQIPSSDTIFKVGETILLRKRDLAATTEYPQFKILTIDDSTNRYSLEYLGTDPLSLSDYGAGCLIIGPHWNSDNITYQDMVFKDIKTRMAYQVMQDVDNGKKMPQQPKALSLPGYTDPVANLRVPKDKGRIVGLWAGGRNMFNRNLYHGSGYCIMRGPQGSFVDDIGDVDAIFSAAGTPLLGNYFCPVCRYMIVDNIDPLQHPVIDANYQNIYPKY